MNPPEDDLASAVRDWLDSRPPIHQRVTAAQTDLLNQPTGARIPGVGLLRKLVRALLRPWLHAQSETNQALVEALGSIQEEIRVLASMRSQAARPAENSQTEERPQPPVADVPDPSELETVTIEIGPGLEPTADADYYVDAVSYRGVTHIANLSEEPLPFGDGIADRIVTSHFLEHLSPERWEAFFAECRRVLKPGGTLRIHVPNLDGIIEAYHRLRDAGDIENLLGGWQHMACGRHFNAWEPHRGIFNWDMIAHLYRQHGFEPRNLTGIEEDRHTTGWKWCTDQFSLITEGVKST